MFNTIIKGLGSVPPAFYVTGLAVISLIIITIRIGLIIQAPYSEFSMNSVKTLMRLVELSFVVWLVFLAVGLYGIRPGYSWWFLVFLCFVALFFAIKFCEFIINNPVNPRTKKQELRSIISFIIAALMIVSLAALIVLLFDSLTVLFLVLFIVLLLAPIALDEDKR